MSSVTQPGPEAPRHRRRLVTAVKQRLRDLNIQLSLFNRRVGAHVELRDVDFDCLEVLNRHGPLSPTELAERTGLHRATVTGIVDRLERGGWATRERDARAADRRAVAVRPLRGRNPELFRLLSGMNGAMDRICADYTDAELALVADFLDRTAAAGATATDELRAAPQGRDPTTEP